MSQVLSRAAKTAADVGVALASSGMQTVSSAGCESAVAVIVVGEDAVTLFDKHLNAFREEYMQAFEVSEKEEEEVTMFRKSVEELE